MIRRIGWMVLVGLIASSPTFAITLVDDEDTTARLSGLVEGALDVPADSDAPDHFDPGVARARLSLRAEQVRALGLHLQVSGDGGNLSLMDASATAWLSDQWSVTVGRFKTGVSLEFGLPIGRLVLPDRAVVSELTLRRGDGGAIQFETMAGDVSIAVIGGAYVVNRVGLLDEVGALGVDVGVGATTFHLGFSEALADPDAGDVRYARNEAIDVGALWRSAGWTMLVEGAVISPFRANDPIFGAYGLLAYRFQTGATWEPEVAGAGDIVATDRDTSGRTTVGLNVHHRDAAVIGTLAYVFDRFEGGDEHTVQIRLQAGM